MPLTTSQPSTNTSYIDRHPVAYDPDEDRLYLGQPGDHHSQIFEALGRPWGQGARGLNSGPVSFGSVYPDRDYVQWYRSINHLSPQQQSEAEQLLGNHFGFKPEDWKVGSTPGKVWIEHRGVKFKDGSETQWPADQGSHVEYMMNNGIHPSEVDDYFRTYTDGDKEYLRQYYGNFWDQEYNRAQQPNETEGEWKIGNTLVNPTVQHQWLHEMDGGPPTEWPRWTSRMPFVAFQHEHDPNDLVVHHAKGGEHYDLETSPEAQDLHSKGYQVAGYGSIKHNSFRGDSTPGSNIEWYSTYFNPNDSWYDVHDPDRGSRDPDEIGRYNLDPDAGRDRMDAVTNSIRANYGQALGIDSEDWKLGNFVITIPEDRWTTPFDTP